MEGFTYKCGAACFTQWHYSKLSPYDVDMYCIFCMLKRYLFLENCRIVGNPQFVGICAPSLNHSILSFSGAKALLLYFSACVLSNFLVVDKQMRIFTTLTLP